jgi:hypothetical protein
MASLSKKEWAGIWLGLAGTAVVALVAAPDLPAWSVIALGGIAGISFSGAAYLLGCFRVPVSVGRPIKIMIVIAVIWLPIILLVCNTLVQIRF